MMAPMSSAIASDRRKTFKGLPILSPRRDITPTANAISVAIGIPHPEVASPLELNATYTTAGKTIPPMAAITGKAAALGSFS